MKLHLIYELKNYIVMKMNLNNKYNKYFFYQVHLIYELMTYIFMNIKLICKLIKIYIFMNINLAYKLKNTFL